MKRMAIALAILMCVINIFKGDVCAETTVPHEIPEETSTCAFPVAAVRAIHVENENTRAVCFYVEEESEPQQAYVVYDDTVHLRLEAGVSDNPASLSFYDDRLNMILKLQDLVDSQRGVCVYDLSMSGESTPDARTEEHYSYVYLLDDSLEEDTNFTGIYLIAGDEYIEELAEDMRSRGYSVTWEYAESDPVQGAALQAYILHVIDQNGTPVPEVMVNFCTDTACTMLQSDESGTISFDGAPDVYHLQLLKTPEGYSFDPDFDMYTDMVYNEWAVQIRKD